MPTIKERPARIRRKRWLRAFFTVAAMFAGLWIFTYVLDWISREQTLERPEETEQLESSNPLQTTIIEGLERNSYDLTAFTNTDGVIVYTAGESFVGIDVSSHQNTIDWKKVKEAGVDYAMIRVGYRGYTQGRLEEDPQFKTNIEGALDAGLEVGVYFFSQAVSPEEALEEAEFLLERIRQYDIRYPVFYDWENIEAEARTDGMDSITLTACAKTFCEAISAEGYQAGIYFNQIFGYQQFNLLELREYEFWLAQYSDVPDFYYNFQMWQYTNQGSIPGIEGMVDMNISFVDYAGDM